MEIIKKLRKEKGMTQKELANELDIAESTISKWESGRAEPGIRELGAISKLFGVSVDELINGTGANTGVKEVKIKKGVTLYSGNGKYSGFRNRVRHIKSPFVFSLGMTDFHIVYFIFALASIIFTIYMSVMMITNDVGGMMTFVIILSGLVITALILWESTREAAKSGSIRRLSNGKIDVSKSGITCQMIADQTTVKEYKWSSVASVHQGRQLVNKSKTAVSGWGLLLTDGGINKVNEVHEKFSDISITFDDGETFTLADSNQETLSLFQTLSRKN